MKRSRETAAILLVGSILALGACASGDSDSAGPTRTTYPATGQNGCPNWQYPEIVMGDKNIEKLAGSIVKAAEETESTRAVFDGATYDGKALVAELYADIDESLKGIVVNQNNNESLSDTDPCEKAPYHVAATFAKQAHCSDGGALWYDNERVQVVLALQPDGTLGIESTTMESDSTKVTTLEEFDAFCKANHTDGANDPIIYQSFLPGFEASLS